jgi:hypothetical protein
MSWISKQFKNPEIIFLSGRLRLIAPVQKYILKFSNFAWPFFLKTIDEIKKGGYNKCTSNQ